MTIYQLYPIILVIHLLSAVIWLGFFPVEINLITTIKKLEEKKLKEFTLQKLLSLTNLTGIIGSVGIILTGILLVIISPIYNFFEVKDNHWLTTKQLIILIILFLIFTFIIPVSKRLKNLENEEIFNQNFRRFIRFAYLEKILVLINFLLAAVHRNYF